MSQSLGDMFLRVIVFDGDILLRVLVVRGSFLIRRLLRVVFRSQSCHDVNHRRDAAG